MQKELISIVIPVYKVERYIEKCLKSVLNQTYSYIEIILVDDGSPDNCGKICDFYAEKDSRIQVIHKTNGGLSDARNCGIAKATGEYITFIDSDDYVDTNHIAYLYNLLKQYQADIAIGKMQLAFENMPVPRSEKQEKDKIEVYNTQQALETMLYNKRFCNSANYKLYRTTYFKEIQYPVGKLYEDLGTTYLVLAKARTIVSGQKPTYHYLINRNDSIMNQKFDTRRLDALDFAENIVNFIKKNYPQIEKAAIARLYMECIFIIVQIPQKQEYTVYINRIMHYLKQYRGNILLNSKMPIKHKVLAIASFGGPKWMKNIWFLKEKIKTKLRKNK